MIQIAPGKSWQARDGLHIDTRGLEPPDPMIAILWHIEQSDQQGPVTVYLDRDPLPLFIELADRGWSGHYLVRDPGDVRLELRKLT
jgi:uncharacterized protein DUF2249